MVIKGIVSAVDTEANTVSVILPEYDNVVTRPIKVYSDGALSNMQVNDFVLVVVFNDDFNDCLVIPDSASGAKGEKGDKGDKGDPGEKGDKGDPGEPGADGADGADGKDGTNGKDGADGYTPVKGTDYFTPEEIDSIAEQAANKVTKSDYLDNSDFRNPINQREKTEYSGGGYTIDRWCFANSAGVLTINDGYISLSSGVGYWKQIVELTPAELGTYTMSLLTYEGELYVASGTPNHAAGVYLDNGCYFYYETTSGGLVSVNIRIAASTTLNIKAIKLERGTTQTLARKDSDGSWVLVDPLPNRQQELAKCQRYFIRLTKPNNPYSSIVGMGTATSTSNCFCICPVPVTMRGIPNVSVSSAELLNKVLGNFYSISSVSVYGTYANNQITLSVASSGTLVAGDLYYLVCRRNNGYIDLSAEL